MTPKTKYPHEWKLPKRDLTADELDAQMIEQVTQEYGLLGQMINLIYREVTNHIPHRLHGIEKTQDFHGKLLWVILAGLLSFTVVVSAGLLLGVAR